MLYWDQSIAPNAGELSVENLTCMALIVGFRVAVVLQSLNQSLPIREQDKRDQEEAVEGDYTIPNYTIATFSDTSDTGQKADTEEMKEGNQLCAHYLRNWSSATPLALS